MNDNSSLKQWSIDSFMGGIRELSPYPYLHLTLLMCMFVNTQWESSYWKIRLCNANTIFKLVEKGKYELVRHTRTLASLLKRRFLGSAKKVNHVHKNLLHAYNRANIGPSKTYQLLKEKFGGYQNDGCTLRDLQYYSRNLKTMIYGERSYIFVFGDRVCSQSIF